MSENGILIGAWIVFPAILIAVSFGLGLLLDRAGRLSLPGTALAPIGFACLVVLGNATTAWHTSTPFTMPLMVSLGLLGYLLGGQRLRVTGWLPPTAAAAATFVAYLAPVAMTGTPTFAGWIKLDDGATWLAFADRLIEAGRTMTGLAPSTYEALLQINLVDGNPAGSAGYPVGSFVPWGGISRLVGVDGAWTLQPYMAAVAAMLALMVWTLLSTFVRARWLRAVAAAVSSSSTLLYGYALWGGIKELVLALLVSVVAWSAWQAMAARSERKLDFVLSIAFAAVLAAAGPSGASWLLPILLIAAVLGVRRRNAHSIASKLAATTLFTLVLSIPAIVIMHVVGVGGLAKFAASSSDIGNLWGSLNFAQIAGIWPVGDFRAAPSEFGPTLVLVLVVACLAVLGIVTSLRSDDPALAVLSCCTVGIAAVAAFGNAWVGGKAIAIASPMVLAAAFAGIGVLVSARRFVEAACAILLVVSGVVWSDSLAYREAWLAPYAQLRELELIGTLQGLAAPALYTDSSVYGSRHFLRKLDAEGASDLRRNVIPLRSGVPLDKGQTADIDAFDPVAVQAYRTLVVRTSAFASRPPSNFRLAWRGEYYEAWVRDDTAPSVFEHLAFGTNSGPSEVPSCSAIQGLANALGPSGILAYVERPSAIAVPLQPDVSPRSWTVDPIRGSVTPRGTGVATGNIDVASSGDYQVWMAGAFRGAVTILLDNNVVLQGGHWLSINGALYPGGKLHLAAGSHTLTIRYRDDWWRPGSAGSEFAFGPLLLSDSSVEPVVSTIAAARADELCGRQLDWIEALAV